MSTAYNSVTDLEERCLDLYSLKLYSQWPKCKNNTDVHQQMMDKQNVVCTHNGLCIHASLEMEQTLMTWMNPENTAQ